MSSLASFIEVAMLSGVSVICSLTGVIDFIEFSSSVRWFIGCELVGLHDKMSATKFCLAGICLIS